MDKRDGLRPLLRQAAEAVAFVKLPVRLERRQKKPAPDCSLFLHPGAGFMKAASYFAATVSMSLTP
jgi:hypothetical protein